MKGMKVLLSIGAVALLFATTEFLCPERAGDDVARQWWLGTGISL